ncbi:hypothetical protein BJ912DRAFT_922342 [Pholiota molesta]|nr:hypothetical protein BJ912DRAFT_922342 [Pholiota molesta]
MGAVAELHRARSVGRGSQKVVYSYGRAIYTTSARVPGREGAPAHAPRTRSTLLAPQPTPTRPPSALFFRLYFFWHQRRSGHYPKPPRTRVRYRLRGRRRRKKTDRQIVMDAGSSTPQALPGDVLPPAAALALKRASAIPGACVLLDHASVTGNNDPRAVENSTQTRGAPSAPGRGCPQTRIQPAFMLLENVPFGAWRFAIEGSMGRRLWRMCSLVTIATGRGSGLAKQRTPRSAQITEPMLSLLMLTRGEEGKYFGACARPPSTVDRLGSGSFDRVWLWVWLCNNLCKFRSKASNGWSGGADRASPDCATVTVRGRQPVVPDGGLP